MNWLADEYTVTAGDVALASWIGRGFNLKTRKWETISAVDLSTSQPQPDYRIRSFRVILYEDNTCAVLLLGRQVQLMVVGDHQFTGFTYQLNTQEETVIEGAMHWAGDMPMCAGALYRVRVGGLAAGNYVTALIGYEHGR